MQHLCSFELKVYAVSLGMGTLTLIKPIHYT